MTHGLLTDDDLRLRPGRGVRSPWLGEALSDEADLAPAPPLARDAEVDIAIVGGGYTGLWTAYQLLTREPTLRVAILEADICGGGPSGRNGGFVNSWWDEATGLVELFGPDAARACLDASAAAVADVGAWCERHGVDAHYRRAGMLVVSTASAHDNRPAALCAAARELGMPDAVQPLSAADVSARCASPRFRDGALIADAATVHPARLARGLRRVCLELGAVIHEGTRVTHVGNESGDRLRVETGGAALRARHVVLAVNAWAAGWPAARRRILAWGSYMVRSEPIPELIERELGWTGGESIVDARFSVHYLHVTRDGRIAIGAGGGLPGFGGRIGPSFTDDVDAARRAAAAFRWLFPQLRDVRLTDAWGGPIDVSADHLPHVWSTHRRRLHVAAGYSGNGVGPSHLLGRILAARVLGSDEPITRLPIVGRRPRAFPPEPFRYLGARAMRAAMIRREDAEEAGRRPSSLLRELSRLPRRFGYHLGPD
ncbi:MAG TPA: FAD-binding oxidoreductase [Methylomirabilota bacterium]|nr:FAD-binding oxidoreductase [Methylomirabilota bacterium]